MPNTHRVYIQVPQRMLLCWHPSHLDPEKQQPQLTDKQIHASNYKISQMHIKSNTLEMMTQLNSRVKASAAIPSGQKVLHFQNQSPEGYQILAYPREDTKRQMRAKKIRRFTTVKFTKHTLQCFVWKNSHQKILDQHRRLTYALKVHHQL